MIFNNCQEFLDCSVVAKFIRKIIIIIIDYFIIMKFTAKNFFADNENMIREPKGIIFFLPIFSKVRDCMIFQNFGPFWSNRKSNPESS